MFYSRSKKDMPKDSVCGMFVEEKPESIRYNKMEESIVFVVNNA